MKLLFLLMGSASAALAQQYFPFQVDQDALSGAPDFSSLNQPLDAKDRIVARSGHFFKVGPDLLPGTEDDQRVRFFGVNMAFGANFPEEKDAPRIARRLRKLGVNLVRFHHMDSQPDSRAENSNSVLLSTGPYPTFNPVAVRRLRVFLDALKAEGVYANINLKVGYVFRPAVDGIPAWPGSTAFPTQSKPLHMIHPRLIELQAQFTRELLSLLELKEDPVLAMVETNNESSLVYSWQANQLDAALLGDYRAEMAGQWNRYLRGRFTETASLRDAWSAGASADGPEMLTGAWRPLEVHSPSVARMEVRDGVAVVTVQSGGAPVILKQVGFSVVAAEQYMTTIEIRADLPDGQSRNVNWDIKQDVSPWRTMTNRTIAVTNQWQRFTMPFSASFAMENIGRMGLSVENVNAPVYVRSASLYRVGRRGLAEGESLEEGNIALVFPGGGFTQARFDDFIRFLIDRDRSYHGVLLAAVRESAGDLVPVAGTQMGFGGLPLIDAHSELDYTDEHYYIDHPNFPNTAWDDRDWRIRDTSSVGAGLSTFLNVASKRVAGLPYTVSEFNQAFPNTYGAEADPTLSAFGAFQDWDSIMHFAYEHGRNWDTGVPSGFNLNVDHTKLAGAGQSAWLFRSGAIEAARGVYEIPMPDSRRIEAARERRNGAVSTYLAERLGYKPEWALQCRVQLAPNADGLLVEPACGDAGQFSYDAARRRFLIHAPQAAGVFGFIATHAVQAGPVELKLAPTSRGFAATLLTSLDGQPIPQSRRLLLSHPGYSLRTHPGSSPERPQALVNYPGTRDWFTLEPEPGSSRPSASRSTGRTPIWMERIEATLKLETAAAAIRVFPLNDRGERQAAIEAKRIDGGFEIPLQAEGQFLSPWFEIELDH